MGFISTANFVGYLLAVLACGPLVRRHGARRVIFLALLIIGLTLLGVSLAQGFVAALLLYFVTGMGSGAANVPTMGLVSQWFATRLRGRAAGIIVVGSGFAIMMTAFLVPAVNARWGSEGWRYAWAVLGLATLAIALVAGTLLRNTPQQLGLQPCGGAPQAAATATPAPGRDRLRVLAHLGGIYFLFGFTYVIYATFVVTTLVDERGMSEETAGRFWFWVGFLSLFSGPVFGMLSDRAGRRFALAVVFSMQLAAYLLAGLSLPETFLYLSIALFGLSAWSVPGIMAASVGDYLGPAHAVSGFGTITFAFGVGQIVGPALAGALAQWSHSFSLGYLISSGLAAVALVLSLLLQPPGASGRAEGQR
jgi:MFS family permease